VIVPKPPDEQEREQQQQLPPAVAKKESPKLSTGKIAFFQYSAIAVFIFLITAFWELQVKNPDFYNERAERNRIKAVPILAPRGKILDRDGRVIVDNQSSWSLMLSRDTLKPEHIPWIADGLNIDRKDLEQRLRRFQSRPKYEPVIIKTNLTSAEVAFVESHRDSETFPEMELLRSERRLYPGDGMAAHLIGYVGEVSEAELNQLEFANLQQGDIIGKFGIERQYNYHLMGVDGQRRVVVDNVGVSREVAAIKESVPGKNLQLTIDLDLQAVAELAMDGRKGAVVALDPRNGEVLAMVSRPTFDPNRFSGRIRAADWREIISNPDKPMINRAIQAQLAPGSTIKPIVALGGYETGDIDDSFTTSCPGGASFYGRYFRCHRRGGHGRVGVNQAIAASCDVYFYNAGNRMGIDTLAHYFDMAGFGRKTGIDLPNEASGVVPSTEWKLRNFREKWYAGETISVSIGQGALTVTPLQLARAIGGVAVGGSWHVPHLVRDWDKVYKPEVADLKPENIMRAVNGMYAVVNEGFGTASGARIPNVEVCGKTGTAQLISNEAKAKIRDTDDLKDNAWFVAFAPRINPEIVVVALVEHGEAGSRISPIARDVIKAYIDKKARLANRELLARSPAAQPLVAPPAQP
jgi:penicillin-binding protein 2